MFRFFCREDNITERDALLLSLGFSPKKSKPQICKRSKMSNKNRGKENTAVRKSPRDLVSVSYQEKTKPGKKKNLGQHTSAVMIATVSPTVPKKTIMFTCDVCGKVFCFNNSLKKHVDTTKHSEPASHQCELCHRSFTYKDSLTRHLKHMHNDISDPVKCNICSTTFKYKFNYYSHYKKFHQK